MKVKPEQGLFCIMKKASTIRYGNRKWELKSVDTVRVKEKNTEEESKKRGGNIERSMVGTKTQRKKVKKKRRE